MKKQKNFTTRKFCKKGDSVLRPHWYCDSVFTIPYDELYARGIRALIYDIDNTLAGYDDALPPPRTLELFDRLREKGFTVGLLSNNTHERLRGFNQHIQLPGFAPAGKPFTTTLTRLMRVMGATKRETALIGDQLFTDVWCGRRAGICAILVKPLTDKDVLWVRIKRRLERVVLKRIL